MISFVNSAEATVFLDHVHHQAFLDASSSLWSSYGNEAVFQGKSVWWFTVCLRCILISTSNNNNTKKKIGLHICAASVVQGKAVGDCLYISNKYEESWAKICVISHESCPCDGVYTIHPCLEEKKKNSWIIWFTAACDITLTPAIQMIHNRGACTQVSIPMLPKAWTRSRTRAKNDTKVQGTDRAAARLQPAIPPRSVLCTVRASNFKH